MQKDTLIVMCSGTGFTSKAIRFLEQEYRLAGEGKDYDLLAVPGSIHSLELSSFSLRFIRDAIGYFSNFLIEKHALKKLIILDHAGCAWFKEIMQNDRRNIKKSQREVVTSAKATLLQSLPQGITLDLWHAALKDGEPVFQKIS